MVEGVLTSGGSSLRANGAIFLHESGIISLSSLAKTDSTFPILHFVPHLLKSSRAATGAHGQVLSKFKNKILSISISVN